MLRCAVFTLNNFTEEEYIDIKENLNYSYLIMGKETGAKTNTPHIQGYIELVNCTRLNTMKKFNNRIHWERRLGTQEQAINYCKKEGNYEEWGKPKKQGERNDLDKTRRLASEYGLREVTKECSLQQIHVAEKYLTYNEEPRDFKPEVIWIYGPSGSGKSKLARELCGEDVYTKNSGSKWWPKYDKHEYLIIDDFRDSWWPITEMLSLLDRYEKMIEYKGGHRQLLAKKIIITSIEKPKNMYNNTNECKTQLLRRIDTQINIEKHVADVSEVVKGNTRTFTTKKKTEDNINEEN